MKQGAPVDSTTEPYKLERSDGKFIDFRNARNEHAQLQDSLVLWIGPDGVQHSIPLSRVKTLYVRNISPFVTLGVVGGCGLTLLLAVFLFSAHGGAG
jgi:hypothetical protein